MKSVPLTKKTTRPEKILLADDEATIRTVIKDTLESHGLSVYCAADSAQAWHACQETEFDLALLDIKMPGPIDGIGLLTRIHAHAPQTVVIMMTGYAALDSVITALRQGAFDYLTKPASMTQIVASVERGLAKRQDALRRQQLINNLENTLRALKHEDQTAAALDTPNGKRFAQTQHLTLDRQKRLVALGDLPVDLTPTEFDLLDYLATHAERVVTARELVHAAQGYDLAEVDARPIVRVHLQRLRQKLGDNPQHPKIILNVRGKGYRFVG
ncbi:MAG: response regulator transcription factor [Chloroflexi bacterium]|nr:response regulator transcription factor [Chloroflexota bacterium]